MKENYCVNCKHCKKIGYHDVFYCCSENVVANRVTGKHIDLCESTRYVGCYGNWFEPKESFMDKLICLFKGE